MSVPISKARCRDCREPVAAAICVDCASGVAAGTVQVRLRDPGKVVWAGSCRLCGCALPGICDACAEVVIRRNGLAHGGAIRGPSDPSDDRIPFNLSDGHAWISAAAVERYGEELFREIGGVDHIHVVERPTAE